MGRRRLQAGAELQHASNLFYTEPGAELARELTDRTGMSRVFYSNSGAEANEGAIKIARKYSFDKYGQGRNTSSRWSSPSTPDDYHFSRHRPGQLSQLLFSVYPGLRSRQSQRPGEP
jgi:hypothetical protein